jgi:hypothetical protein
MKRICSRCNHTIRRTERWHKVKSRLWGFLWTVEKPEHYSCLHPQNGPSPKRLKGEVPLPFPDPLDNYVTPAQELANL